VKVLLDICIAPNARDDGISPHLTVDNSAGLVRAFFFVQQPLIAWIA
jgi:hypothetical protein